MPAYDYQCAACGRRFEVVHGVHADGPTVCPLCGKGPVRKSITAPAVHYKGSGWAKKERRATVTSAASAKDTAAPESSKDSADGTETSVAKADAAATDSAASKPKKAADAGATSAAD